MRTIAQAFLALSSFAALATPAAAHPAFGRCPVDSVKVGTTCIDKYEASVWQIPDPTGVNRPLVKRLQKGKATLADLTAVGAIQLGCTGAPWTHTDYPPSFPDDGNWTAPAYAASVPGVRPSMCITWFQAEQACALANKRLPTNQEWQRAAAGTPDPGASDDNTAQCEVGLDGGFTDVVATGSRLACKSSWGVFDMVGNAHEWVADWVPISQTFCPYWDVFSDDIMCLSGVNPTFEAPGALMRGGDYRDGTGAGVFAVQGDIPPTDDAGFIGFRCAR
jgi:formylglycine-generating enzyme required for sulfatase activity